MDNKTAEQRHENMSRIKGKDTKPEILVRKYLFARGFRYRKNVGKMPGHPDIVLPKYRAVVFVHGCFWHGHENCRYARIPSTNISFWEQKIRSNRERDAKTAARLLKEGWNVIVVWQCELKNKAEREITLVKIENRIKSGSPLSKE